MSVKRARRPVEWLDRSVAPPGPYLALVLSEDQFLAAARDCKVADHGPWVNDRAQATTHLWENPKGESVAVIALRDHEGRDGIEVAGLIVHEAVHVWQHYRDDFLRERHPAIEQEAYAIQWIAQVLMNSFAEQAKKKSKEVAA